MGIRALMSIDVERIEEVATTVVHEAVTLHRELGPGLLESVYEVTLADALSRRGLGVQRQTAVGLKFRDRSFPEAFRADLIVEESMILEIKSIDQIVAAHRKQLLTYLRLSRLPIGFLLNFGAAWMKDGIVRMVNGLPEKG